MSLQHCIHNPTPQRNHCGPDFLSLTATEPVRRLHRSVPAYAETPLVSLSALAAHLGVKGIYVKDESHRFGLNAFKGLGGIYVLACTVCDKLGLDIATTSFSDLQKEEYRAAIAHTVFATTTDGNHGKGVAWAAGLLGCQAKVFMPKGSSPLRAQAIREAGLAEVTITDMNYDDTVRYVMTLSEQNGWTLLQDTSWEGYEEPPRRIVQGYTTMAHEALAQIPEPPTHVFLQAGVGAMAGSVTGFLANVYGTDRPRISIVEPDEVACIYASAACGAPHAAEGTGETIMAGLNCGEPCTVTWPILRDYADDYFCCPDCVAAHGMRLLASPKGGDSAIVSGESGAATMGALSVLLEREEYSPLRRKMGLDENAVILLFSTEGDTDPEAYRRIVSDGVFPLQD